MPLAFRQITIRGAFLANGGLFQVIEGAFHIQRVLELGTSSSLFQQLTIERD
jgi:hypothetical protein